ncbi:MAG: hypothetical protein U1F43_03615 [Myxococcota bacterium]
MPQPPNPPSWWFSLAMCALVACGGDTKSEPDTDTSTPDEEVWTPPPRKACTVDADCGDDDACTWDEKCGSDGLCQFRILTCDDENSCTSDTCDSAVGCLFEPFDGGACDDGNPCTADVCIDGGCTATAIPGCVVDAQCANKDAGVACNDQDSATSGDLCLAGACHGFTTAHVAASVVSGAAGMVVKEIDHNAAGWSAVLWTIDGDSAETYVLADLTTLASPFVYVETEQTSAAYSGLRDGFAADSDGYVWELEGDAWSYDNTWTNTLFDSGLGEATDLWTMRDTNQQGALGARRMWIVGNDGSDEWVRYCFEDDQGAVKCEVQDFDDFQSSSLPTAVWGVPSCDGPRCQGAMLATAADAATGGGAYLDTYENDDGTAGTWSKGSVPGAPATRTSRAIVGWGSAASAQFLAVGTNGHMVHRRANGSWSSALNVKDGQSTRNFSGVWEGSGVVAVSATHIGTGGMLEYELWTCPSGKDVETGSNWTIHLLGQFVSVSVAGLYDVAGSATGEMRVVGANKKPGDAASQLLEGLVFVRTP